MCNKITISNIIQGFVTLISKYILKNKQFLIYNLPVYPKHR